MEAAGGLMKEEEEENVGEQRGGHGAGHIEKTRKERCRLVEQGMSPALKTQRSHHLIFTSWWGNPKRGLHPHEKRTARANQASKSPLHRCACMTSTLTRARSIYQPWQKLS